MARRRFTQGLVALATIAAASVAGAQGREVQEGALLLERLFLGLDVNQNGRIERPEAQQQLNRLVGAVFFQTDTNGDGVVSVEEARAASSSMPGLSRALGVLSGHLTGESLDALEARIGVEWGQPISAAEAREATDRAVDALFTAMDLDHDGGIDPAEVRASWTSLLTNGANPAAPAGGGREPH